MLAVDRIRQFNAERLTDKAVASCRSARAGKHTKGAGGSLYCFRPRLFLQPDTAVPRTAATTVAPPSHCQNQAALPADSFSPGWIRTNTHPFQAQTCTPSGTT